MSLNRSEQRIFDYLQRHPDERQFWQGKFQRLSKEVADEHLVAERLEPELWRYYLERSSVVPALREAASHESRARISMKNLAELLQRLWVEPRPKKRTGIAGAEAGPV